MNKEEKSSLLVQLQNHMVFSHFWMFLSNSLGTQIFLYYLCVGIPPTTTPGIWGIKFKASFDFLLSQCQTIPSIKMANWWKRFKINTAGTYFIKCLVPSHWISPCSWSHLTPLCRLGHFSSRGLRWEGFKDSHTTREKPASRHTYCSSFSELVSGAPAGFSQFLKPRMKNSFLKISSVIWKQAMELFKDFSSIFWYQYVLPRYPGLLAVF